MTRSAGAPRVLLTGGGTGGHVYPVLAVAEGLVARLGRVEFCYVGVAHGTEAQVVPQAGLAFRAISGGGWTRRDLGRAVRGALASARGLFEALGVVREFRPDVAIGSGGYVSGPVVLAAWLRGVPTAILELDAQPGVTNRLLSLVARVVFAPNRQAVTGFPRRGRVEVTGVPVRPAIARRDRTSCRASLGIPAEARVVLMTAGSGGAQSFAKAGLDLMAALAPLGARGRLLWATGPRYHEHVRRAAVERGIDLENNGNHLIVPYLHDMPSALAAADLVVCRAGTFLYEVAVRGLPAVIVPSPHVANDHQAANARVFEAAGAAEVRSDEDLLHGRFAEGVVELLLDEDRCRRMGQAMRGLGSNDALDRIVDRLIELGDLRRWGG